MFLNFLEKLKRPEIRRLVGGSAFILANRIFGAAVTFLTQILLARWMGAAELGNYVLAYSWLVILAGVSVSGYSGAAMRFVGQGLADEDHGYVRGFLRHATIVVCGTSLALAIIGGLVFFFFEVEIPGSRTLYFIALAGVPLFALIKLNVGLANAFSRFAISFVPNNVVRPVVFVVAIWITYRFFGGLQSPLTMQVQLVVLFFVVIMQTILVRSMLSKQLRRASPRYETGLWYGTASSLLLLSLFTNYFPEFTVILTGFFLPGEEIAIFNAAFRIALLIMFGLIAIDAFAAPDLVRCLRRGERAELLRVIRYSTKLRFWAALGAVILFVFFGRLLLGLFGAEFVAGYSSLLVLALAQLAQAAVGPSARLISVSGHQKKGLVVSAASLAICTIGMFILVPRYGTVGAAGAAFIATVVWSAGLRYLVQRHLGLDPLIFSRAVNSGD